MGNFLDVMDLVFDELIYGNQQDFLLGILKDILDPDISYDDLSKEGLFSSALLFAQNHSQLVVNAIDKYVEIVYQIRGLGESGALKLMQKIGNNFSTSNAYKKWKKVTEEIELIEAELQSLL